jgi:peptide/nickel transport system permease protein
MRGRRPTKPAAQLVVGLVMVTMLLVAALAGPALAPFSEDHSEKVIVVQTAAGPTTIYAPQPPSRHHLLGTDRWGYDIFSLLLYGARYTVFAALGIALVRVLLGGALGLLFGMRSSAGSAGKTSGPLGGIPAFIVIYFLMLGININSPLSASALAAIEGALIVLLGIPAITATISLKTAKHRQSQHVLAAVALGAGRCRVATHHVLPLLREDLLLLFSGEVVLVLVLIGQLAVFDLFFGGTVQAFDPILLTPRTHEWASMIGASRTSIQAHQWLVLGPLGAFLFAVVGFQMVASGLERRVRAGYVRHPML